MPGKSRRSMQVAPEFEKKLKHIQEMIMRKDGKLVSIRDITEGIAKYPNLEELENSLLNSKPKDFGISLDRRKKL
jgi:hypothetical protein